VQTQTEINGQPIAIPKRTRAKPRQQPRDLASELAEAEAQAAKTRRTLDRWEARMAQAKLDDSETDYWPDGTVSYAWMAAAERYRDDVANTLMCEEWWVDDLRVKLAMSLA
jgi:hypothetical protein